MVRESLPEWDGPEGVVTQASAPVAKTLLRSHTTLTAAELPVLHGNGLLLHTPRGVNAPLPRPSAWVD